MVPPRRLLLLCAVAFAGAAHAVVPPGYRYVGSRVVSEGRVVYWYWNDAQVEVLADGTAFVARLYARAADVDRERPYVAVIRCDQRAYREYGARGAFESIDDGEPIDAVWRAGCRDGRTVFTAAPKAAAPAATAAAPAPQTPPSVAALPAGALRAPRRWPIRAARRRACASPKPRRRPPVTRRSPTPAAFPSR